MFAEVKSGDDFCFEKLMKAKSISLESEGAYQVIGSELNSLTIE